MAMVAVLNLLGRLSSPAIEEMKLIRGAEREVKEIKAELEFMRSFLQDADADAKAETDEWVKTWVKQVREVANDAEDILDEYYLRLVPPCNQGIFSSFLNCIEYFKQLITRRSLANEMKDIKTRIKAISKRSEKYNFKVIVEGCGVQTTSVQLYDPRIASLHIDEAEVVGIKVPKNTLIEWLTNGELKLTTISVVGMGGLGKTTLVKKVYDSPMVKKQNFNCHVWITVSKSPVIRELLLKTIKGVLEATKEQACEGMNAMDNDELIEVLNNRLQRKRYVIIFDDIWDINVWEAIKFAFPNCNCGSRIMFTTREGKVAKRSNYLCNLKPLNEEEAWKLFCMKAFGSNKDNSGGCPKELKELSRNILKKCSGLPLAIVLIGGLLSRKAKTTGEWKNIRDSLGAEMMNNYELESLSRILLLSYNNLPYYLKPCFMHLSMFPEDYFIRRMTLIRMWTAEGFVEEKQGVTMEVVAGDYINELISRSMIEIAELTKCNEVKSCRIHDLVRETVLAKSKEECFSTTNMGAHGMGYLNEKVRRISIYHNNSTGENNDSMVTRCSNIRSLMVFQLDENPHSFQTTFLNAFRLLRVLDLEGSNLAVFPPELVELIHLRYLSLGGTKIIDIPKSIGKLKNLETLDLKKTCVSELPVEILNLQRLRHLIAYRSLTYGFDTFTSNRCGVSVPTGTIGNLTCLHKLSYLDVEHQTTRGRGVLLKELGKLTQLRKLGIMNLRSKDGRNICLALEKMKQLDSLDIERSITTIDVNKEEEGKDLFVELDSLVSPPRFLRDEEFLELESLVSPPQFLRRLHLNGRLRRLPVWIANSLWNLTTLSLTYSRLSCKEDDPLKAFQHMPNLVFLRLNGAYDGEELCTNEVGGYQNLTKLFLFEMEGLKRVRFWQGSMPMLRVLKIWDCPALEMVPLGIEHLSGLEKLELNRMHPKLLKRIKKVQGEAQGTELYRMYPEIWWKKIREAVGEAQGEGGGGEDHWKIQHINYINIRIEIDLEPGLLTLDL